MPGVKTKDWTPYLDDDAISKRGELKEVADCAVIAVMHIMGVSYEVAHDALAKRGRKPRSGTPNHYTFAAIRDLGGEINQQEVSSSVLYRIIKADVERIYKRHPKYLTSHSPERWPDAWPEGRLLMINRGHIWAVVDKKNMDWSRGRSLRAMQIIPVKVPAK